MTLGVEYDTGTAKQWDDFVRTQPGWTHFRLYGWRSAMQRAMGHDTPYLVAPDDTTCAIQGVLPLARVKSILFGRFLVSVPLLNYGGPLGSGASVTALTTSAADLATSDRHRIGKNEAGDRVCTIKWEDQSHFTTFFIDGRDPSRQTDPNVKQRARVKMLAQSQAYAQSGGFARYCSEM